MFVLHRQGHFILDDGRGQCLRFAVLRSASHTPWKKWTREQPVERPL